MMRAALTVLLLLAAGSSAVASGMCERLAGYERGELRVARLLLVAGSAADRDQAVRLYAEHQHRAAATLERAGADEELVNALVAKGEAYEDLGRALAARDVRQVKQAERRRHEAQVSLEAALHAATRKCDSLEA
jgi:hypothetical protein